jgi:hypothetical protein
MGMEVTATYSDSSSAVVTTYTVTPSGALATTDTSITISYTEGSIIKTATQAITFNAMETVATPVLPASGKYTGSKRITITCNTAGADIYYTTNGDTPTASSTLYTAAFKISSTTTVKAIAVKVGMSDSAIASATYKRTSSGGGGTSHTHVYGDTWKYDASSHWQECTANDGAIKGKAAHIFGEWKVTKEATATTEGSKERTCTVCGYKATEVIPGGQSSPLPFTDVKLTDWFYKDIEYVFGKNIMQGTSATTFAPNVNTTRAMIVTVLYRLENEPMVGGTNTFEDVADGQWYTKAITWAQQNKIVEGYNETTFGPNDNITREQMAAILYRYAKYKGYDVSVGEDTNILSYEDALEVSEYAITAMQWACGAGLIKGTSDSTLSPKTGATRAQVAAIIHRFHKNVK